MLSSQEKPRLELRLFFVDMAAAVILCVFAGLAPTLYLRGSFTQTRPMSALLHIHGIVFSGWVTVFLVQSLLIARAGSGAQRLRYRGVRGSGRHRDLFSRSTGLA